MLRLFAFAFALPLPFPFPFPYLPSLPSTSFALYVVSISAESNVFLMIPLPRSLGLTHPSPTYPA
ncbi:hypothetical protein TREMEDRAFT_57834 [Tremella mesenterica DSM 1558]|uniref:uncharacterized protein n=1 Tax=Tremella mesenterica (strain ATCC 24925 / CBS 8224 / DSM 1558 / NBRC 9311 / NRRL Y-6157 / RJB 2259-6 / UBC 559-6) TaxID=578456 RepID=UPI00032C70AC|nr:uncharacterized protein TREMEDRAFT_57834 [Tremella mesenterica DSM 1558]EIW66239.1 hypothetical protein TREMEDRAFT_57834 [Tremella mesenterica DSM 1558]